MLSALVSIREDWKFLDMFISLKTVSLLLPIFGLRSFVCLTAHWLGDDFVMHSELLSIYNCTERHTSDNLCQFIVGLLKDMELDVSSFS